MRLADAFPPEEQPTRPDTPRGVSATLCACCFELWSKHQVCVPPVPPSHMWEADCFGMRANFTAAASRPADKER